MVIDRSKHNKYSVNLVYTPSSTALTEQQTALSGSSLTIYISGGSGSGSGLTEEQLKKLESIEEGALVNQNAFSTVLVSDGSITNEITAQNPSDTIKLTYINPIEISLVDGNILISYVDNDSLWSLDESGNLWTDRNVYSTKEISAYGFREGGVSPGGASYLYELGDVDYESAFSPINKGILQYNSTLKKWVVTDGSSISPDTSIYATKLYVTELINLLIGSAPNVLDTIYEIAEALNNDPDYVKDIANNLSNLTNRVVKLEDMFEWDGDKIKAKADLYGIGEISAYGYGSGSASSGVSYLRELLDVNLTNIADQCILQYNSSTEKWEATDGSTIRPDLSGYATQTWVTLKIQTATESLRNEFNSEISEIENSIVTINGNITVIQGNITTINDEILAVKANITSIKSDISTIKQDIVSINNALDLLNRMFEWDGNNIKAKANLYSVGEISAYGYQDGSAGSGAQYLHELLDVTLTGLTSGLLLQWNGSKWININKDEVGLNESELLQYLTENNYAKKSDIPKTISWVNITNKPSWITDQKPTYSWTDITNKPTIFTTNIGNISDLNSSWDSLLKNKPTAYITRWPSFSEVTNKPTTLSGYGITDGVNSITLTGSGNAVTSASINGHVITLTKGSTFSLSTHNHDSVYVNVTGDTMTGTLTLPTIVVNTRIQLGNAYIEYDSTNNAVVIKNKTTNQIVNFYATGEVSAYGYGDGTNPSGVTYLSELKDVKLTSIAKNDMLVWNGSGWVNTPMADITPELNIDNITDLNSNWKSILKATPSSYVTRWPTISEVLNKQNLVIKLNSGTTEGTNLFTYNVTTAKTVNITPSAIGAAASSHNHSWSNITSGKPTTLAGYGITDGVNTLSVTGSGNAITAASVSGHTLTLTKGSTFLLSSAYTAADILAKLKTVDGSGSGLDADLLDGIHANGLFTNLSNSGNNISITVGGTNKTLTPAYATNAGGALSGNIQFKLAAKNDNGGRDTYLLIADCSVLYSLDTGGHFGFNGIIICHRDTGYPINEVALVSAIIGHTKYNHQLYTSNSAGVLPCIVSYNSKYYVALRLKRFAFNLYMQGKWQNTLSSFIQLNVDAGQTYPTGMSVVTTGIAYWYGTSYNTHKLYTPRTLWGKPFDGTANVSGDMTGVGNITMSGNITGFRLMKTAYGDDNRSVYMDYNGLYYCAGSSGWAMGINARNQANSVSLGAIAGVRGSGDSLTYTYYGGSYDNPAMVIMSNKNIGIGTKNPEYKLYVAGTVGVANLITAFGGLTTTQYIQIGSGRIYWDAANKALYVKSSDGKSAINFYATGEVSAYGAGSGGSSGGGVSYLHELEDVTISSQKTNDMLKWNGSKWVNIPMSDVKPDLSNYVTKDGTGALGIWNISISGTASLASSVAWANVTGKPTTLSGYGITDAYTKTESDNKYRIIQKKSVSRFTSSGSWYRIAQSSSTHTSLNYGKFYITDKSTGNPFVIKIDASISYNNNPTINAYYYSAWQVKVTKARIVYANPYTTQRAYLEVYINSNPIYQYSVNFEGYGWELINPVATTEEYTEKLNAKKEISLIGGATNYSTNFLINGNTVLHTGNYTTTLDTRYVKKAGDTMTGSLKLKTNSLTRSIVYSDSGTDNMIFGDVNGSTGIRGSNISFQNSVGRSIFQINDDIGKFTNTPLVGTYKIWHAGNDGSGSGLDADLLDGTHKTGLLTALSSSSATNLSITVGGTTKSVADLYATTAEKLSTLSAGSATRPVYFANGIPVAGTYTFGNASGNAAVSNGTVCTNLNADLLDGLQWSNYNLERLYTINASSLDKTKFYPIFFTGGVYNLLLEIYSPGGVVSAEYNTNRFRAVIHSNGWDDSGEALVMLSRFNYQNTEITIGAIGFGSENGGIAVWVRGGRNYTLRCNRTPSLKTSDYTYGTEIYTVGTNLYGGTNTKVTIKWQNNSDRTKYDVALISSNVASATKLQTPRTIWGQSFDGTSNVSGTLTGATDIIASGNIQATSLYAKNGGYFYNDSGWFQNNKTGTGLYNKAEDARWYASSGVWRADKPILTSGTLTASRIIISNTSGLEHVEFSRAGYNYIVTPASGIIAFDVTGSSNHSSASDLVIQSGSIHSGTTNATSCGTSSTRWSNIYSVLGNFSGAVTFNGTTSHNAGITSTTGNFTSNLKVSGTSEFIGQTTHRAGIVSTTGNFGSTLYVESYLTANSGVIVPYTGSKWISMATRSNLIRSATNNSVSGAHALFRVKNSGGDAIVFGGLGTNCGFYGFTAETISAGTNNYNWATYWDVATGKLTHSKAMSVFGAVTLFRTLSVAETSTFTGKTTHNGGLQSTAGTFTGAITVSGESTFSALLHVNGGAHTPNNKYFSTFNTSGTYCSMLGIDGNNYGFVGTIEKMAGMVFKTYDLFLFNFNGSANYVTINKSGIVCKGEITAFSSSDIRLKKNLKELKAINTLRKINIFEYDWTEEALLLKANKNVHDYGIIAQELELIIPEAVTHDMYGKGYLGIDYTKLVPFTISAIKEVDDEVTTLKKRVKELEDRLSKYESSVK